MIIRVMRVVVPFVVSTMLALALCVSQAGAASPAQVILRAHDLPGWRAGPSQAYPSRDIIQLVDVRYPRGPRPRDGYIAAFFKTHMSLNVYIAQTESMSAAKLAVKHFRSASTTPVQRVALGSGGWYGEDSGLSTGSGVVWSTGNYVLGITLSTLAPKAGLTKAQIVALARIMQSRAG